MSVFKKLRSGEIIFVLETNNAQGVLHGINLLSPILRPHNYSFQELDKKWDHNIQEIVNSFEPTRYYFKKSKHVDNFEVFDNRRTMILNAIYGIQHVYKKTA